jgi:hypothetical protein
VVIKAPPDGTAQTMAVGDDPAVLIN